MLKRVPPRVREIPKIRKIRQNRARAHSIQGRRAFTAHAGPPSPHRRLPSVGTAAPASDHHSGGSFASQADHREALQRDAFAVRARQPEGDNQTSEAKLSENMITTQNQDSERVPANSAVAPGLDNRGAKPAEAAGRTDDDSNGSSAVAADPRGRREPSPEPVPHLHRAEATDRENQTSKANRDENVIIAKNQDPVRVAANSVVAPGLDKQASKPDEPKGRPAWYPDPPKPPPGAESRPPRPPQSP